MRKVEDIVKDHLMYLDAVQEFTDWLHSAKEELHRWSDTSGDSSVTQKKLLKIKVSKQADTLLHWSTGSLVHKWQIRDKGLVDMIPFFFFMFSS